MKDSLPDPRIVKQTVSIDAVVGAYVQLRQNGPGRMVGLCPFHEEDTPSFMVYLDPKDPHCTCFGCHWGGDVIKFVRDVEGVDFKAAVKILVEQFGAQNLPNAMAAYRKAKTVQDWWDRQWRLIHYAMHVLLVIWNSEDPDLVDEVERRLDKGCRLRHELIGDKRPDGKQVLRLFYAYGKTGNDLPSVERFMSGWSEALRLRWLLTEEALRTALAFDVEDGLAVLENELFDWPDADLKEIRKTAHEVLSHVRSRRRNRARHPGSGDRRGARKTSSHYRRSAA